MINRRFRWCSLTVLGALALIALSSCGVSSGPAPTDVPVQAEALPATEVPVVAETVTVTESPVATETPEATRSPTATETPAGTTVPADTVAPADTTAPDDMETSGGMAMKLTSTAFEDGGPIPSLYTCDDQGISPPLAWEAPPVATQSFALICDDPDAPGRTWVHWVMYNIPPEARSLAADLPADATLPDGTQQGQNSWPRTGYGGPCPPSGTHRYIFNLYALDTPLDLEPDATDKAALLDAMEGHVLAEITLTGLYERQR